MDAYSPPSKSWPKGATAGVVLVAALCLAVGVLLYLVAGPRDVIDDNVAIGWDQLPGLPDANSQD